MPFLKAFLDHAPVATCIVSANDFVLEMVNDRFAEIIGVAKTGLLDTCYWDFFASLRDTHEQSMLASIHAGQPYHADHVSLAMPNSKKDQNVLLDFVYAPILDDNGVVSKVAVWLTQPVLQKWDSDKATKIRAAEEERERLYQSLQQAPIGFAVLSGPDMVFEEVNQQYQDIHQGRSILNRPFLEALPELNDSLIKSTLLEVYEKGTIIELRDHPLQIADLEHGPTTTRDFNCTYIPRFNAEGEVDGIFNFAVEVTHTLKNIRKTKQANNDLAQIINMLPASVVVIRGDELIVEMINDTNLDYWKKSRQEVVGKPFLEILPDLANQPFAGQLRHVMETGEIIDVEESPVLFTMPDGSIRETFVDYTYQPLSDLHGNRTGVLVMSFEITERVLSRRLLEQYTKELSFANDQLSISHDKLAKSEARFKFLIQETPVAIGLLQGRELIVEMANEKILEVWGKTNSIIGMPLEKALPELEGQPFLGILDNVFTSGKPFFANEIPALLEHDGALKQFFFNLVYQPVFGLNQSVADILIVAVDVTEQVNSRRKLEHSEQHFRRLADLVPAMISNALPDGEWTFLNQKWLDYTGMSFDELQGFGYFQVMHPEDIPIYSEGLNRAAASGASYVSEIRFKNTQGKYVWHLNTASPVMNAEGQLSMWVGSATDIQALKEEDQRKNDFIAMVSHELKTPLTSLNGYLQILYRKALQAEDAASLHAFESSLKQVRLMTQMTNGFLNVSRLESAKIQIDKTTFDMAVMLAETAVEHHLLFTDHEIIFHPLEKLHISGDREKLGQVINNLVSNAVKYSPRGSQIEVFAERIGDHLRVSVKDSGIGVAPENIPRLFERYFRVENSSNVAGFGIGLYLCAEIIALHHGRIDAISAPNQGSTFYFELPLN
ncbi:PAS domain-containing protein [Sphingobacterium corticibacter]|uniref:histidine kinase n=1 Tax=Sphingobacterium corticibacter TaxID=2171749 RepID=A0A2T8HNW6_9SPHI|nr:PAS domain-containing protein [Sphingobacterium corticibacter]PVH27110.1 hypothetical protein DC487_05805 [Sphingobacterium corticibacter]